MNAPDEGQNSHNSSLRKAILRNSWQPHINTKSAFPFLIAFCVVFTVLSLVLLIYNSKLYYEEHDYTHCESLGADQCQKFSNHTSAPCSCIVTINFPKRLPESVRFYYKIKNMHQNHRLYAESFDFAQQTGQPPSSDIPSTCDRLAKDGDKIIYPCGLVPNSMFNDTYAFYIGKSSANLSTENLITLPEMKIFKNPDNMKSVLADYAKPPDWKKPIYELDPANPDNNGFLNTRYITWMRIYPFPDVLKQLGELNNLHSLFNGEGHQLNVVIGYNYPVSAFDGRKILIVVESSWIGIPNAKLGYIYCCASILSFIFVIYFWLSTYLGRHYGYQQLEQQCDFIEYY